MMTNWIEEVIILSAIDNKYKAHGNTDGHITWRVTKTPGN